MRIIILFLFLISQLISSAQNNRVEVGAGVSLTSFTIKNVLKLKSDVETSSNLTKTFSYHRNIKKGFWFGGEVTTQNLSGSYQFQQEINGISIADTLSFNYKREGYMASAYYAFPFENEALAFSVGLRAGIRRSKISGSSANENVNELLNLGSLLDGVRPRASIPVTFGYYPIKNVGLTGTVNIGPTYVAKLGFNIKF